MCTRPQDRQGTPARSASRTSLANVPATCVQGAHSGYIQDVLVFETLRIIIEPMADLYRLHHSHAHLPHCLVPPTMSDKTLNILQWNANGIGNKQTELSISSRRTTSKLRPFRSPSSRRNREIPTSSPTHLGPGGCLLFVIHNSVSFTHNNVEESLWILQSCSLPTCISPRPGPAMDVIQPHSTRHRFTSARRLQCSPFTLALH